MGVGDDGIDITDENQRRKLHSVSSQPRVAFASQLCSASTKRCASRVVGMKSGRASNPSSEPPHRVGLSKVPEVTIYFWIIKILATTVGETAADYLNMTLGFGLQFTSVITGACWWSRSSLSSVCEGTSPRSIGGVCWSSVLPAR